MVVGCAPTETESRTTPAAPQFDPVGDGFYVWCPDLIVQAIRSAEGVPSYGIVRLARLYGSHRAVPGKVGRAAAARLLHSIHRGWIRNGRQGWFLVYLQRRWAP